VHVGWLIPEFSGVSEASVQGRGTHLWDRSASERPEGVLDLVGRDPPLCMGDGLHGERATDRGHLSGELERAGESWRELVRAGESWRELVRAVC